MTDQTPSTRAGLRDEIADAIHRYDRDHCLSRNDIPSKHHRGEADAVLTLLYREWPWLRAEAEELDQARAELQQHAEAESADAAAGSYANSSEHAIAHPQPWLHIEFTSPHETTANTSALALADHLTAEFDGVNMRITSNAVEPAAEQPARTTPDNPAASENAADNPAATEATDVGNKPDAPAWTPPPPGSDRDKLPDHLLPLIADRMRPYLSTACETAAALEAVAPEHPAHAGELRQWTEREHASCRLTRKQDMADCVCGCHGELKSCGPNSSLWPIS